MSKREFPLFIFDLSRDHNLGECDFVACTDVDNAFVAKIDYVTGINNVITDNFRINRSNGKVKLRIEIKRITGKNPDNAAIRTLMKKAEDLYCERSISRINIDNPSKADMLSFLEILLNGNKHNVAQAGVNSEERKITLTSISMLEAIKRKIEEIHE